MKLQSVFLSATALSFVFAPISTQAHAQAVDSKSGSAYLQCDGLPNNRTDGETAARLIGAVTLLGVFAPPPEAADASKRKFGAEGVAVCSGLITRERQEGNPRRRLGLILGRAIHHIEAKNYNSALADVGLARREANVAGLVSDGYFSRTRASAFDLIESAALLRLDRVEDARSASLRSAKANEYSLFNLFALPTYGEFLATPSAEEERVNHWRSRLFPALAEVRADRLELAGRFAEAARVRDALIEFDSEHTPQSNASLPIARAAVAHALAGNAEIAAALAKAARSNADKRRSEGKPESDAAELVEMLDLHNIIETAGTRDVKTARHLFAARSQWVSASLGSVLEVNRRLRSGAAPAELVGGLARDEAELWTEQVKTSRATLLAKDSDNNTLFRLIPVERSWRSYQAVAKNVWRTDKSKIILKTKADPAKSKLELMFLPMIDPMVAMDAYVLHAALIARSRGHQGFVFMPVLSERLLAASFRTGNRGDRGFPADLFLAADDVIAKLSPIIPDPALLRDRQASR